MAHESSVISRIVRWAAIGLLICASVVLYFRMGTRIEPLTAGNHPGSAATAR